MGGSRVVATLVTVTSYTRKCGHGQRNGRETGGRDEWRIDGWKDWGRDRWIESHIVLVSVLLWLANTGIEKHRPLMMEQLEENTCLPEYWGHYKPVVILGMPVNSQGDFNFWLWCTSLVLQWYIHTCVQWRPRLFSLEQGRAWCLVIGQVKMASSVRRSRLKAGCIPSLYCLAETEKCSVLNLWHNHAPGSNALISGPCRRKENVIFPPPTRPRYKLMSTTKLPLES